MSGATGATAPAQSHLNKSQHYAKNLRAIQNHTLSTTFSRRLTRICPAVAAHPRAAHHRSPAKPQNPAHHQNLANLRNKVNARGMKHRPSTVKLSLSPEEIDGQTVTFRPIRDGIDSEVSGVLEVIE